MKSGRISPLLLLAGSLFLTSCSVEWTSSSSPTAAAQNLDQYGGYRDLPAPGGATGFFRIEKMGTRWVFVTPEGNAFWMLGVFGVTLDSSLDDRGNSYTNRVLAKYGTVETWGMQTALRLKVWGFNAVAEYSDYRVWKKIASIHILNTALYSLTNRWDAGPGPTKEVISSTDPAVYTGWRGGSMPDVFDPNFALYVEGFLQQDLPGIRPMYGSPWLIGIATDDRDYLFGFGAGDEIPAAAPHAHLGWLVLIGNPSQTSGYGGVTYTDPAYYAKLALRDWVQTKYGTVAALNAAWGSNYTTFDSAGGWGTGTGFLDEKGTHPWVGTDYVGLSNSNANLKADLNEYLYRFAKRYFSVMTAKIRAHAGANHLVFGPATLNSDGLTRKEILRAAGEEVDVVQASIESQAALDRTDQYTGNRPLVTWEGYVANPDSAFFRYGQPNASWTAVTQPARGLIYANAIISRVSAVATNGNRPIAGIKYWELKDNWREKLSWGLVSLSDNAYNGREAIIAAGTDPWGYATGGEERDYGDFLSAATQANAKVKSLLLLP